MDAGPNSTLVNTETAAKLKGILDRICRKCVRIHASWIRLRESVQICSSVNLQPPVQY